jgi:hypothetical protein
MLGSRIFFSGNPGWPLFRDRHSWPDITYLISYPISDLALSVHKCGKRSIHSPNSFSLSTSTQIYHGLPPLYSFERSIHRANQQGHRSETAARWRYATLCSHDILDRSSGILDGKITYLCGNSLGLSSKRSIALVQEELTAWSTRCVFASITGKLITRAAS